MPALVAGIHEFPAARATPKVVDARTSPGMTRVLLVRLG